MARVGNINMGKDFPVTVQTMYDSSLTASDPGEIVSRISGLNALGCDIIRFSFITEDDQKPFEYIAKSQISTLTTGWLCLLSSLGLRRLG